MAFDAEGWEGPKRVPVLARVVDGDGELGRCDFLGNMAVVIIHRICAGWFIKIDWSDGTSETRGPRLSCLAPGDMVTVKA